MSYEPTNWKDGDLVTSAKLNKIEQGIAAGGGVLIVHMNEEQVLDKTWQEIHDADVCFLSVDQGNRKIFNYIFQIGVNDNNNTYIVIFSTPGYDNMATFISSSPDDYPTFHTEDSQG